MSATTLPGWTMRAICPSRLLSSIKTVPPVSNARGQFRSFPAYCTTPSGKFLPQNEKAHPPEWTGFDFVSVQRGETLSGLPSSQRSTRCSKPDGSLGAGIVLAGISALSASLRLVLEALLCIELLLTSGEYELLAALFAYQCLVCVHSFYLS